MVRSSRSGEFQEEFEMDQRGMIYQMLCDSQPLRIRLYSSISNSVRFLDTNADLMNGR